MSVLTVQEAKIQLAIASDDFNSWIESRIKTFEFLVSYYTGRSFFDKQSDIDELPDGEVKEFALLWENCPSLKDACNMFLGYAWQNRQITDFGNALPAIDGFDFYINPFKRYDD